MRCSLASVSTKPSPFWNNGDGRILLTVVVIFRILIVAIVGETVYEDEQTMFMCNTLQPGCNQACYDKAFPISHIRYWVFQIILVCTPSLCFITYSVHQAAKQRERRYSFLYPLLERDAKKARTLNGVLTPGPDASKDETECVEPKETPGTPPRRAKAKRHEGISRFYVIQVVFRNALEIGFLAGQYFLYGFNVPAIFECDRYPCVKEVECYVSRPTEKTVFLVFMFAVSGICVLLNLAELNHLGWRKVKAAVRGVQARRKSLVEVSVSGALICCVRGELVAAVNLNRAISAFLKLGAGSDLGSCGQQLSDISLIT
ncbi:UNVERIFIED_CONTAM: hypothetical protein H355_014239 [Colinus virginianus]|nr:hypothetical protein H355_014239 [Colinus virginianus]